MKSNESHSPVDQYFRQHEAEIPVTYDSQHWSQLLERLDANQSAPATELPAEPSASRHSNTRRNKAWWVSGIWMLAFCLASLTLWQRAGSGFTESPETDSYSPVGETSPEYHSGTTDGLTEVDATNPGQGQSIPSGNEAPPLFSIPTSRKKTMEQSSVFLKDSVQTELPSDGDSLMDRRSTVMPKDSIPMAPKVGKKKKFLFW